MRSGLASVPRGQSIVPTDHHGQPLGFHVMARDAVACCGSSGSTRVAAPCVAGGAACSSPGCHRAFTHRAEDRGHSGGACAEARVHYCASFTPTRAGATASFRLARWSTFTERPVSTSSVSPTTCCGGTIRGRFGTGVCAWMPRTSAPISRRSSASVLVRSRPMAPGRAGPCAHVQRPEPGPCWTCRGRRAVQLRRDGLGAGRGDGAGWLRRRRDSAPRTRTTGGRPRVSRTRRRSSTICARPVRSSSRASSSRLWRSRRSPPPGRVGRVPERLPVRVRRGGVVGERGHDFRSRSPLASAACG
jgi:hypothetical protein